MNAAIAVGLPGPAPPATGTSPPADVGSGDTAPFAQVLEGAGPPGPVLVSTSGEPPGPEPGLLDMASLLQLLLGGEVPPGGQTEQITSQLDRPAGAGTKTEDTGMPVDGEMLVALVPQLVVPVVEPEIGAPSIALPVADATAQQPIARDGSPTAVIEVLTGSAAGPTRPEAVTDTPRVILPSAAADAPRAEAAPVVAAEVEQQHALPLAQASVADTSVSETAPTVPVTSESVEEPIAADLEANLGEPAADDAVLEPALPEPVRAEVTSTASREPAAPVNAEATVEAVVAPASQPATSSTRSTSPVSATEPVATPPATEAFTVELASTVRRASLLGDQEVRLLLNPPELGHLDVRIVESPQGLRVVLEASMAEARELIEQQLPALRTALEARDLKVERIQVEQALDASSAEEQFDRGLRQDGQGGGSDQSESDATPWSPIASLRSDGSGEPIAAGAANGTESASPTVAADGRVDVMA